MSQPRASAQRLGLHLFLCACATSFASTARSDEPATVLRERVEFSSPLFPKTSVLYASEGPLFPATLEAEESLAHAATLTYETLLVKCQESYPAITLASGETSLTAPQLAANYNAVAQCAYATYTVKPYWIPKLVDDVSICERELGAGWRLPTEADVASLTLDDFTVLESTLSTTASSEGLMGTFYFSLGIYVRAQDGSIKKADLSSAASERISSLNLTGDSAKYHYEAGLALRCIRRTQFLAQQ